MYKCMAECSSIFASAVAAVGREAFTVQSTQPSQSMHTQ